MPSPKLSIGDGALGFWKAIRQVYPETEEQRCWVHKTANVLDKLPKTVQSSAKSLIHNIYQAETEDDARAAYARFQERYEAKYPNAVTALKKNEATLFTFYVSPHNLVKRLFFNTPSGDTHIEFATVKQDPCSVTCEVMKPSC
jgi:putative transposase